MFQIQTKNPIVRPIIAYLFEDSLILTIAREIEMIGIKISLKKKANKKLKIAIETLILPINKALLLSLNFIFSLIQSSHLLNKLKNKVSLIALGILKVIKIVIEHPHQK